MLVRYGILVADEYRVLAECDVDLPDDLAQEAIAQDYREFCQTVKDLGCETFLAVPEANNSLLEAIQQLI